MIYLDYAATSGRKPDQVYTAVDQAMRERSGNPGRSGHKLSLAAGEKVAEARFLSSRENANADHFAVNARRTPLYA